MNILKYAANNEQSFALQLEELGYTKQTTFYGDLSIAECFGANAVKDTYQNIVNNWLENVEYFTEFVMALNYKIWQHYEKNLSLAKVYNELWNKASELAESTFTGEDLAYYYRTID